MPNSKLALYIEITRLLRSLGPQTINQIGTQLCRDNQVVLRALEALTKNKLITKSGESACQRYTVTETGVAILSYFRINSSETVTNMIG